MLSPIMIRYAYCITFLPVFAICVYKIHFLFTFLGVYSIMIVRKRKRGDFVVKTKKKREKFSAFCRRLQWPEFLRALPILAKWLLIAGMVGLIVGFVASGFGHALIFANQLRAKWPWLVLGLPVGGLVIVFLYRVSKNHDDRGTNTIVASIQESSEIPFKMAPLIFVSTVITQLFGGSAGREGAALQLGGSIAKKLGKLIRLGQNDQRTIIMCGMSAGFSALFGTPLAAAIFSLEVVSVGIMHYSALVPCVTAALIAHFVADFCQIPPEVFPVSIVPAMDIVSFLKIVAFAVAVGGTSVLFCVILHKGEHAYEKYIKNPYLRIVLGGILVAGLAALMGTGAYLGSGMGIIEEILHHGHKTDWYAFLLKMIFTMLTLGAGFKGGEIVPSLCIGAALGSICGTALGLPMELVAACGMAGLFCGVTNAPISSLLLAFELFGYEGMPYYLVTVAVSFLVSGCHSLYKRQKIVFSKTHTSYQTQE